MRSQSLFSNPKMSANEAIKYTFANSWDFEVGMRQILGNKAYHTADHAGSPPAAKRLLLKATRRLSTRVDEIITMDPRLRERLLSKLEMLQKHIAEIDRQPVRIHIIGLLFEILSRLLGYDWMTGNVFRTPIYFRTKAQELSDYKARHIEHWRELEKEENELVFHRRKVCLQLKEQGMRMNQIARVLNISEYEVSQLIRDQYLDKMAQMLEAGHSYEEVTNIAQQEGELTYSLWKRSHSARKRRGD